MSTVALISAGFSCLLAIVITWANPQRRSNWAFGFVLMLLGAWLLCVFMAMTEGERYSRGEITHFPFWLWANAAIISFLPSSLWILTITITGEGEEPIIKTIPFLLTGVICSYISTHDSFLYEIRPGLIKRGIPYYLSNCLIIISNAACIAKIWHNVARHSGIQRVELQLLAFIYSITVLLVMSLNTAGNALNYRPLNRVSILVVFIATLFTAWALTFHRIFNAREVITRVSQRVCTLSIIGALAGLIWFITRDTLSPHFALSISTIGSALAVAPVDEQTRRWFGLTTTHSIQCLRRQIIDISRTDLSTDTLSLKICQLLAEQFGTSAASLIPISVAQGGERMQGTYDTLFELTWATSESLDRRRQTPEIQQLTLHLLEHGIGLAIAAPKGSPAPSLVITLTTKLNGWPFTFPEVERLQAVAELIDNTIAHARLVEQAALRAKMDHLSMLSKGLAHDLRNLITPISSFLVYCDGKFGPDAPEAEVHLSARRAVAVMGEYLRQALFFSERLAPKLELVDCLNVCSECVDLMGPRAQSRGVKLVLTSNFSGQIIADKILIQRMLTNLLANAIDASPEGHPVELKVHPRASGWIQLIVKDAGCGIADAHVQRLFEPYFTTKALGDDMRGIGLGLTIAEKIAVLHNGSISVSTSPGEGTTMTVELPIAEVKSAPEGLG